LTVLGTHLELRWHCFGRWAETLPEDQLQLGLEEARRNNERDRADPSGRQAADEPGVAAAASAARRDDDRC